MSNILIVDDQPQIQHLFSKELMDEGYSVTSVGDAEAAIAYCKNASPDLVLLDLYLDGFNGWKVLRDIKRTQPHLPVLITTAYDNYADDSRLSKADGYIVKSLDNFEKLKEKIADILKWTALCTHDTKRKNGHTFNHVSNIRG